MKSLILIASLLMTTAKPAPANTINYTNKKLHFSIEFPYPAIEHPYVPTPRGLLRAHSIVAADLASRDTMAYLVIVADVKPGIIAKYKDIAVDHAGSVFAHEVKGSLLHSRRKAIAVYPTSEFSVVGSNDLRYECMAVLFGARMYLPCVVYSSKAVVPVLPFEFFNTFQVRK